MTPPQAQEAGIDFEEARQMAEKHLALVVKYGPLCLSAEASDAVCRALLATHEGEKARYREAERVIRAARALEWSLANMVIDGKPPLWSMNVIATRDDLKRKLAAHEETERETAALAEAEALIRRADAERARALREQGLTLRQIAAELGVNAYGHPLCVDEGVMPVSSQAWKDL